MTKSDLRVVFMGTPDIAAGIVRDLIDDGYNVVLGLCQPDKPVGRKQILTAPPVKVLLEEKGIPVYQPKSLKNEEAQEYIRSFEPDLVVGGARLAELAHELLVPYQKVFQFVVHNSILSVLHPTTCMSFSKRALAHFRA